MHWRIIIRDLFVVQLPLVVGLEERWLDLYGERCTELMERRRQDTRDQAEEITTAASQSFFFCRI